MFPTNGPTFLVVYLALFAASLVAYRLIRAYLAHGVVAAGDAAQLTIWEIGYLVSGPQRALGAWTVQREEDRESARSPAALGNGRDAEDHLVALGLILDRGQRATLKLWGAAIYGGLLAAGASRVWIGVSRGKPVAILFVMMLVVAFVLYRALRHHVVRTPAGERLTDSLIRSYARREGDCSLAMGFAVLGWPALEAAPAMQVHMQSQGLGPTASSGSSCTASSCTASSCSGGGSSCSGGGCGGCGGD